MPWRRKVRYRLIRVSLDLSMKISLVTTLESNVSIIEHKPNYREPKSEWKTGK